MAGHSNGPRRPRGSARSRAPRPIRVAEPVRPPQVRRGSKPRGPIMAAAQLMTGITLSCLTGALVLGTLAGAVILVVYLSR